MVTVTRDRARGPGPGTAVRHRGVRHGPSQVTVRHPGSPDSDRDVLPFGPRLGSSRIRAESPRWLGPGPGGPRANAICILGTLRYRRSTYDIVG